MIEEVIPAQGFEIVREALGMILKSEIDRQQFINPKLTEEVYVYSERTTPISNSEEVVINVSLSSDNFTQKTQQDSQGKTYFNIDLYSQGEQSEGINGGLDSAFKLHRYIGLCRYILQHTIYKVLKLPLGIIGGVGVDGFEILDNILNEDSGFSKMGRLTYWVRIQENQEMIKGVKLSETFTDVKLELTEKGYIFTNKIN